MKTMSEYLRGAFKPYAGSVARVADDMTRSPAKHHVFLPSMVTIATLRELAQTNHIGRKRASFSQEECRAFGRSIRNGNFGAYRMTHVELTSRIRHHGLGLFLNIVREKRWRLANYGALSFDYYESLMWRPIGWII
jgi:hypothetical protein